MCLDRLEKFPVRKNKDGWVVAWKLFYGRGKGRFLAFSCQPLGVSPGKDIHVANRVAIGYVGSTYQSGFHAYKTEYAAQKQAAKHPTHSYRRVLLKDITATGYQDGLRVIVARKMIVPKEGQ